MMQTDKINFKTIDDFIAAQPENIRSKLSELRNIIKKACPDAEEIISYSMPAYKKNGIIIYFSNFKNHYSIFVRPAYLDFFRNELKEFKLTKSAVNIPNSYDVPQELVYRIASYAMEQNEILAKSKKKKN